ncbi:unnamed protein product [Brassica rapa]|uniref:F-box domain-containing protein n=2 Tax=Brassica TaxID=3705 RepID=A0A3P6BYR1_BRACM|nr:unnamed protein product [Brassica napus]CAG7905969.1 unnamed protein product [Brassica rapa]CDY49405.1 BnaCnng17150D [Brassica napus]VDD11457.1 unnamed protein product [Brassica rapa]
MAGWLGRRRQRQRRKKTRHRKTKRAKDVRGDFISSMPDEILHHILSFTVTISAIRTSALSRRWRHLWRELTSLYIHDFGPQARGINQILTHYTAPKIMSFHLGIYNDNHSTAQINSWIEFAMSRRVQDLSLTFFNHRKYTFPDFFNLSSSIEQLSVKLRDRHMIPGATVSWESLRNLSLRRCRIRDESIVKIISGCPKLEFLALYYCALFNCLDLSKSLSLTRLEMKHHPWLSRSTKIIAPNIHYLRLKTSDTCNLVDVSSLTEAYLDIGIDGNFSFSVDYLLTMVLKMIAKLQNVERLTVSKTVLQILSVAEIRRFPFRVLRVQTLIVKIKFVRSAIPGTACYLNSQGLKLDKYWRLKYGAFPTSCETYSMRSKDSTWKLLASFIECLLRNTKMLETLVVWLGGSDFNAKWFKGLLRMVPTLSDNTNVSIMLKLSNC